MDFFTIQHLEEANAQPISSHLECMAGVQFNTATNIKQQAFQAMAKLEGWCQVDKAAVLMDLIFWTQPQKVVEIGVFGGKSLVPMAYALRANGQGVVYGIDPWSSHESIQGMDGVNRDYWAKVNHESILHGLIQKINQFGLQNQIILVRNTSAEAVPIPDIDILHIDGNHGEETSYIDVVKWVPLVKKGGLIIFDDINWSTTAKAVQWVNEHCIKIAELRSDDIWGIWVKS